MSEFQHGPFDFSAARPGLMNGQRVRRWTMSYGNQNLGERTLPEASTQGAVIDAFGDARSNFERDARSEFAPDRIHLVDFETDQTIASFDSFSACGMTPGLIDDRSPLWLRSSNRLNSRPVSLQQYGEIVAANAAPELAWASGLLPDAVLTSDPEEWHPPSSWEIRHVVGEGSFTGVTGAAAAALVGVQPQGFRKYTARDGAASRQNISFAMWHLLLHKLGVKSL